MSKFQSNTIISILKMIQNYDLVLPAFQREYVWKPEQVERLFDSLMKGYPINSMLFWRVGKSTSGNYRFYKMLDRFVENKLTHNDIFNTSLKDSFYAIIDGQQRLTSLNLGLRGTYAFRKKRSWVSLDSNYPARHLYLNITEKMVNDEGGMTYEFKFLEDDITKSEELYQDLIGNKWFRVGKVLDFSDETVQRRFFRDNDLSVEEEGIVTRLYRMVFHEESVNYYVVDTEEPDIAVDVFVRTNSGGTTLSYADILLSITIANWEQHNRDARTEIYGLVNMVNNMGFSITHDYILKAFLYLYGKDVKMRITSFDNALLDEISNDWEAIREAILILFSLLRSFGLNGQTLTSAYATLPILYYLYWTSHYKGITNDVIYENERLVIKLWLMKTLLVRTFGYRSDHALRQARKVLSGNQWECFPSMELADALEQHISDDAFYESVMQYKYDNRYTFAVLALLYSHMTFEGVEYDIDHLHPQALWYKELCSLEIYNSLPNLQLLPKKYNISKSDKPLEQWVQERVGKMNISREMFLHSSLIPDVDLSIQNFPAFFEARKQLLIEKLKEILG